MALKQPVDFCEFYFHAALQTLRELLAASLPLALNTLITLMIMATFTTVSAMPAQRV
jgi:hypothetical protein